MNNNSGLTLLIDQATSSDLTRPDPNLNLKICKEIFSKPDK